MLLAKSLVKRNFIHMYCTSLIDDSPPKRLVGFVMGVCERCGKNDMLERFIGVGEKNGWTRASARSTSYDGQLCEAAMMTPMSRRRSAVTRGLGRRQGPWENVGTIA